MPKQTRNQSHRPHLMLGSVPLSPLRTSSGSSSDATPALAGSILAQKNSKAPGVSARILCHSCSKVTKKAVPLPL